MQKKVLTAIGVLFSAALTIQTATAAARSARKAARAPDRVAHQLRDAAPSGYSDFSGRHGLSAPAANGNKNFDIIWCYED